MGITFSSSISDLLTSCLGFLAKPTQYICELEGNLDALQIALEKVSTLKNDVMGKVNIVERQQTKQLEEIQQWLIQAEAMETLVKELINDGARQIEKRCLNGCCPRDCSGCSLKNCTSIYKLGKDVVKKMDDVDTLYEQGQRFRVMANRLTSISVDERPNEPTVVLEQGRLSEVVAGGQPSILVDDMPSESTVVLEQGSVFEVVVNGLTSPPADERLSEPTMGLEQGGIFEVVGNGLTSIATIVRPSELTVGLEEVVAVAGRLTSTTADERPSESTVVLEQGSLFEVVVNGLTSPPVAERPTAVLEQGRIFEVVGNGLTSPPVDERRTAPPVDERPAAVLEQGRIFEVVGNGLTSIATIDRPSELTVDLEEVSAGRLTSTAADERPSEPIAFLEEGRLSEAVAGRLPSTPVDEMPSEPIMGLEQGRLFEVVSSGLTSPAADERPSEATVGLESSFAEVWSHIIDEQVGIIGLYGMSGIGKTIVLTKIHNKLCDPNHGFNGVIWVEMSKNRDPIVKDAVQDDIGKQIGFDGDIWKNKSREEKAIEIFNVLSKNKFVLFLDDIRERLKLSKLGIPPPNNQNNSKIIFTTKYEDMCNRMKAHKKVEVKCLSLDEAWVLYDKMVPKEILSAHPETHKLAKIVAAESLGLPIALKHVGQTMACEDSLQGWPHAGQVLISEISDANMSFSQDIDDQYEKFIRRMNAPTVQIDNETCENATVIQAYIPCFLPFSVLLTIIIGFFLCRLSGTCFHFMMQVDSSNKHGILVEIVQVLADLNLIIIKAYISSDAGWFMDVFHVTDQDGNKIRDESILEDIRELLGPDSRFLSLRGRSEGVKQSMDHTLIELTGHDRPGLLSEVSAVLSCLQCNVVNADVWTHNSRAAAVMQINDEETGSAITDPEKLPKIEQLLCNVITSGNKSGEAKTVVAQRVTHTERRLHQMMLADCDYERLDDDGLDEKQRPSVSVVDLHDKGYSVVTIRSKDRPKLLFDTVCTLTDMQYVVYHANIDAEGLEAYQEYYIRHIDGFPVSSDAERQRLIKCLQAAIERRVSEGWKAELCCCDRVGLLSDVTRIFRENSLTVTRAEVTTKGGRAISTFYVRDASGYPVDEKTIDSIRKEIGLAILHIKACPEQLKPVPQESSIRFLFGGLFKS